MSILKGIGSFLKFWLRIDSKYQKLKNNEEKKEKSISLGVHSIVDSVLSGVIIALSIWGLVACITHLNQINSVTDIKEGFPIMTILGIVVLSAIILTLLVQGMIEALLYLIYQFKLNKRAIRWVSLAVWIVAMLAIIVTALALFLKI